MGDPLPSGASGSADEIRVQMNRILASPALAGSDQLKRFLRRVVERALEGQPELLKEYSLGLEVFRRPPDYDPKVDPIVRVQARRLRAKLQEYYAGEGAGDPYLIDIPKGSYVPQFHRVNGAPGGSAAKGRPIAWRPRAAAAGVMLVLAAALLLLQFGGSGAKSTETDRSVAVLPLQLYSEVGGRSYIADQVTEVLTTELAKKKQLRVLSRTTASGYRERGLPLPEIARTLGVRWVVEGGVGVEGTHAYVKLRLVDSLTDRKVWADGFDCEARDLVTANVSAADRMAAAIAAELQRPRP